MIHKLGTNIINKNNQKRDKERYDMQNKNFQDTSCKMLKKQTN